MKKKKIHNFEWLSLKQIKQFFSENEIQSPTLEVRPEKWSSSLIL